MAALLTFCVLAAVFPPVGLAADPTEDLRVLIDQDSSGVIDLGGASVIANDVSVDGSGKFAPFVINKPVTIQNGSVFVRAGGIVLGEDVAFSNVTFHFPSGTEGGNFIAANGHTLTLEEISCAANSYSFSLFCGTFTGKEHPTVSVPEPGVEGIIILKGAVNLQSSNSTGNLYAGNVYRTTDGNGTPEKVFNGNAAISFAAFESTKSNVGTFYACGATQTNSVAAKDETYTVSGNVSVTGALPNVDGAGCSSVEAVYQGSGNQTERTFQNISSLSVEGGNLVLANDSWFPNDGTLSLASDAKLNLSKFTDHVPDFHGNDGLLILGTNQTLMINGQVTGTAKAAIGGTTSGDLESSSVATPGHPYIMAPNSTDGNFRLLPYAT